MGAGQEATFVGMLGTASGTSGKTLFWTVAVPQHGRCLFAAQAQCPKCFGDQADGRRAARRLLGRRLRLLAGLQRMGENA